MKAKPFTWRGSLATLALGLAALGGARAEGAYPVEVWFDATFDTEGRVVQLLPVNEAEHPAGFWQQLKDKLATARLPVRELHGQPASLRTGLRVDLVVGKDAQGQGKVAFKGVSPLPLPLERYYASYPKDVSRVAGWEGVVDGICTVGLDGKCSQIEVKAPAGMPESVRRYMKVSLEGWRFKPQQLNGEPIEGTYVLGLKMFTNDDMPKDFREPRKL